MNNEVLSNEEIVNILATNGATNIFMLDTATVISVLVIVVFMIKLFNNVVKTNSVGQLTTSGRDLERSKRNLRMLGQL